MIKLEDIAHQASAEYSRCSECNGICKDTATNCDKSRLYVCPPYWNGYHTALIAMKHLLEEFDIKIKENKHLNKFGLEISEHFIK